MAANPTVAKGQRARAQLVSKSHGIYRQGLVEHVEGNPEFTIQKPLQVSLNRPGVVYTVHTGGSGKIDVMEKNQNELYAVMQDLEPTSGVGILNDLPTMQRFGVLMNFMEDSRDVVFASKFIYGALAHGGSVPVPAADAVKRSFPFGFLQMYDLINLEMRYARARTATAQLTTPGTPTFAQVGDATPFTATQPVYIRLAHSDTANVTSSAPPLPTEPLTRATQEFAVLPILAGNKITITFAAAVPATNSFAIYVGKASGQETFYGWAEAAATTFDVLAYADPTNARPPRDNVSGAWPVTVPADLVFGSVTEGATTYLNAIDLGLAGAKIPQYLQRIGLPYVAVLKNSLLLPDSQDDASEFAFSPSGRVFYLGATPAAADTWELVLPVLPG